MTEQMGKYSEIPSLLFVFFMLLAFASDSTADMYKWVDKNGVTHFSDSLPPDDSPKFDTLPTHKTDDGDSGLEESKTPETGDDGSRTSPSVKKKKARKDPRDATVEVYVTSWCHWCKQTKAFFQSKGISFVEYDIEKDKEAAKRRDELDSRKGVPFTVINGKGIHGYNEKAFEDALNH